MVNDNDSPEFKEDYHLLMINGILWQMFSKTDAETLNKVKAEEYRQKFLIDIDEIKQEEEELDSRIKNMHSMDAYR